MYEGWFEVGSGNEIGNNVRFYQYALAAAPTFAFVKNPNAPGILDALNGGQDYLPDRSDAPWRDPDEIGYGAKASQFLGMKILDIAGLIDSTWEANITQGITDGGVISDGRYAAREIRVRAFMMALNDEGIEYGIAWLRGALEPGGCAMHEGESDGSSCGTATFTFFSTCPEPRGDQTDQEWAAYVQSLRRHVHGVKLISGPLRLRKHQRPTGVGMEVEFTFMAENPHVYTDLVQPDLDRSDGSFVLDSPYNLIPAPSAELRGPFTPVSRNYITNPSFEVSLDGWLLSALAVSGSDPAGFTTFAREQTPAAPAGNHVGMIQLLGDGATTASGQAAIGAIAAATTPTLAPGEGLTLNAWVSAQVLGGSTSSVDQLLLSMVWIDSQFQILREDTWEVDPDDYDSYTLSEVSTAPPAGPNGPATGVVIGVTANVTWASNANPTLNSDIRIFMDAFGIIG